MYRRKPRRGVSGILLVGVLLATWFAASSLGWLPGARPAVANLPSEANLPSAASTSAAPAMPSTVEPAKGAGTAQLAAILADLPADEPGTNTNPSADRLVSYIVRQGDTLSELAQRYKTTVEELLSDNPGLDAAHLAADHLIKVPDLTGLGEARPHFAWPADGPITTPFGVPGSDWIGGYHMGLDIGADMTDIVWSAGGGVIVDTGTNGRNHGYGTYILIYHYDGWWTLYAHLSKVYRDIGYPVRKGEPIGEVGMTGYANGPHLHLETWHDDDKVDPIQFLP